MSLDGVPIDTGSIRFTSLDESKSPAAGTKIREGKFDIPQQHGLPPGEYRLSISSPDLTGPKVPYSAGPGRPTIMVTRDRIPLSYNVNSRRTIELAASEKNYFEFDIASSD